MALEVSGLHRDDAVVGSVALIEAIMGKAFPIVKNGFGFFPWNTLFNCAFNKFLVVLGNLLFFFLGNRRAQVVRFGGGIASQLYRGLHNLFLVNRVSVSIFEDRDQLLVGIPDLFLAVHALDVFWDAFHRTGAEKRDHGNYM